MVASDKKFQDWDISKEEIEKVVHDGMSMSEFTKAIFTLYRDKHSKDAKFFGLKKDYTKIYPQLKEVFPNMKFVSVIRDGRAVFKSKKNSIYSVTGKPFCTNPIVAAKQWCEEVDAVNKLDGILKIHYEDLILNTGETIDKVLKYLEIDRESVESSYEVPERYGELHTNIDKKPDPTRIEAWKEKITPQEILAYELIAQKQLGKEGYELHSPPEKLKKLNLGLRLKYFVRKCRDLLGGRAP